MAIPACRETMEELEIDRGNAAYSNQAGIRHVAGVPDRIRTTESGRVGLVDDIDFPEGTRSMAMLQLERELFLSGGLRVRSMSNFGVVEEWNYIAEYTVKLILFLCFYCGFFVSVYI
jgi:hypothetical protein